MTQKFKFPMEYLRVTQGQLDAYSHAGSLAMDFGGRDGGADRLYAPCDMVVKRCRQNANGELYLESCEKVLFADGTTDYARLLCMHDGSFNVAEGQVLKQGDYFYDEGGMGSGNPNAFAVHVHIEAGKGKWASCTQTRNSQGTYVIERQAHLYDLFVLGDDVQLLSTGGYSWKKVTEPTAAGGREREAEEGKVTSGQDWLQPVAERADNFSGHSGPLAVGGVTAKQEREESHPYTDATLHQSSLPCVKGGAPAGRRDCHSEAQSAEESPAHPGSAQPDSICDTSQSAPAQYDSALVCGCLCHSEAQSAEESPAHPGDTLPKAETQPGSICDTCQSSPAQYDSTLACTCPHTAQLYTENRSLKEIIEKIKQTVNGVNI